MPSSRKVLIDQIPLIDEPPISAIPHVPCPLSSHGQELAGARLISPRYQEAESETARVRPIINEAYR